MAGLVQRSAASEGGCSASAKVEWHKGCPHCPRVGLGNRADGSPGPKRQLGLFFSGDRIMWKSVSFVLLAVSLSHAADPPDERETKTDLDKLKGSWSVVS